MKSIVSLVAEQLRFLGKLSNNIILEPEGRNTAPAIALASLAALQTSEEDPLLLVLAADHVIRDEKAFLASIKRAIPHAASGSWLLSALSRHMPKLAMGIFAVALKNMMDMQYQNLSRNQMQRQQNAILLVENTTGIVACFI